jgi:hypothetical protein
LTGFLWVPTHNNPRFPAPEARGRRLAVGRRSCRTPLVTGDEWRSFADVDAPMAHGASRTNPSRLGRRYTPGRSRAARTARQSRAVIPTCSVSRWPRCRRPPKCADWRLRAGARRRPGRRSMIGCSDRRVTYGPPLSAYLWSGMPSRGCDLRSRGWSGPQVRIRGALKRRRMLLSPASSGTWLVKSLLW